MSGAPGGHGEGPHRPVAFYLTLAVFLTIITAGELGPLFGWYHLPPEVLLFLSATKFFCVIAFFMHLWDDAPIFSRLFGAPLLGALSMVVVLMLLFHTFAPSPKKDNFAVAERYRENYNQPCNSWLRSNKSNRWYCASPPIEDARVQMYMPKLDNGATHLPDPGLAKLADADRHDWLMKNGADLYGKNCANCHKADGTGTAGTFPPLAKSDYLGDPKNHARIVVKGISGDTITVNGQKYAGMMPAQGPTYKDYELAAILTYERNSWGNTGGDVGEADVAAAR